LNSLTQRVKEVARQNSNTTGHFIEDSQDSLLCRSQGIQIHSFVPIALSCSPAVQPNPLTKEWRQRNAVLNPEIITCPCAFVIRNYFVRLQLRVGINSDSARVPNDKANRN
jgi:hypothetical protein